jgi:TolB protein
VGRRRMSQAAVLALAVGLLAGCSSGGGTSTPAASASTAPTPLPGRLVYAPPENTGKITLQLWTAGTRETQPAAVLSSTDVLSSTTLSPDGTKIAYLHSDGGSTALTVSALDGSGPKVLLTGVEPSCDEPNWSADGSKVAVMAHPADGQAGSVPVAGGAFTPFPTPVVGCHLVWSGDGSTIAYASDTGIMVARADGTGAHAVPKLGPDGGETKRRAHDPMSLSADGKLVALFVLQGEDPDGDVSRSLVANGIVDTTTGATVTLPVTGELQQAFFLPKGGLLVRTNDKDTMRLTLLSTDLKVRATAVEPPTLTAAILLGYAA